jgi:hypothetical protein
VTQRAAGQDTVAVHGRCLQGVNHREPGRGPAAGSRFTTRASKSAEITALTVNETARLPAGPVLDHLRKAVPATPGNMTDPFQRWLVWRLGAGARPVPQRLISGAGGRQAAGREDAGRSR